MPRLLQAWWRTPRRLAVTGLVLGLVLLIPGIFVPALWVTSALLLAATLTTLAVLAVLDRRPGHHLLVDAVGGIVLTAVLGPMLVWPWTRLDTTLTTGADWSVEWHEYPMEHSAVLEEIVAAGDFIRRVLAAPAR